MNNKNQTTQTPNLDRSRVIAIYSKPFNEWTDEEAACVRAFEKEEDRKAEERKREIAARKAESDRLSREYWAKVNEYYDKVEKAENEGTVGWFASKAKQRGVYQSPIRITRHVDKTTQYLFAAYRSEVAKRGGQPQFDEYTKRAIVDVSRWAVQHTKPGLMLRGYVGVGKTTMLHALATLFDVVEKKTLKIIDARRIATLAKDDKAGFEELTKCHMLGIDDLGTEPLTVKSYGNEMSPVNELLTERYNRRLFTVVTTNLTKKAVDGSEVDELQEVYGDRLFDRFKEMFNVVSYAANQKSYRK